MAKYGRGRPEGTGNAFETLLALSLRHCGRMLHLGIGRAHARTEIIALVRGDHATVIEATTGHILTEHEGRPPRRLGRGPRSSGEADAC